MRRPHLVVAGLLVAGVATACTSSATPSPDPVVSTPSTSSPTSAGGSTATADTGDVPLYDASTLTKGIGPGSRPPDGSRLLHVTEGSTWEVVDGTSGPLSVSVQSRGNLADVTLVYQLDTARPTSWTRVRLDVGQGAVVDGRLLALAHWAQVGSQPRVEAWLLDYPAAAAEQLPTI